MKKLVVCALLAALLLAGCVPEASAPDSTAGEQDSTEVTQAAIVLEQTVQPSETVSVGAAEPADEVQMTAHSSGITDGVIDAKYGHSSLSLPLEISGAPEGTVCFAVYMDDPDAVPVCGYRFVHWMAANIAESSLAEDFSRQAGENAVQGKNDFGDSGYGGPAPPDKDHTYEITVYALDARLKLSEGFSKEEFAAEVEAHTLAASTLKGLYKK